MIINQWVPAAHRGDAIGDSARRVRDLLRGMGHQSELYALAIDDDLASDVRAFSDGSARQGDLTIFHYALPSPMTAAFASLSHGRILQYHNVTPASYFAPFDPALFRLASLGRRELATLVGRVISRLATRSTTVGSSTGSASAARACSRSPSTRRGSRSRRGGRRSRGSSSTTGW